jgi:lipopolysaccharide export system permease protein
MLINQLLLLTEWVSDKGIRFLTVANLFVKLLPSFFLLTIPMATIFAAILAFNRLSFDHEVTALRASGIGVSRMLRPVFIFAVMTASLTLLMGNLALGGSFKSLAINILKEKIGVGLETARFAEIFPGLMIYAESIVDATKMDRVFIYDGRSEQGPPQVIVAQKGLLINNGNAVGLELQDGAIYTHNNSVDQRISFGTYSLKLRSPRAKTAVIQNDQNQAQLQKAIQKKYSLSYASFLFCFLGVPLGILSGKGGRLWPFVIGIAMILFYYSLYNLGDYFFPTTSGIAIWVPNLVFTPITICTFIFYRNKT